MDAFKLSSDQCELLVALESLGSIKALAQQLARDESVISRQIKVISGVAPVLEKKEKRWVLTPIGRALTKWSRDAMEAQARVLQTQTTLTVATTREFSAKVLIPNIQSLLARETVSLSIITSDDGIEEDILSGRADFGIDCGRPEDPLIRFKSVLPEPYAIVASPDFLKRHRFRRREDLLLAPHVKFQRDSAIKLLALSADLSNVAASFNDISSVRAACCAGMGWATLPRYAVLSEINAGMLVQLKGWNLQPRSFGVWWVRGRSSSDYWAERAIDWLEQRKI